MSGGWGSDESVLRGTEQSEGPVLAVSGSREASRHPYICWDLPAMSQIKRES